MGVGKQVMRSPFSLMWLAGILPQVYACRQEPKIRINSI